MEKKQFLNIQAIYQSQTHTQQQQHENQIHNYQFPSISLSKILSKLIIIISYSFATSLIFFLVIYPYITQNKESLKCINLHHFSFKEISKSYSQRIDVTDPMNLLSICILKIQLSPIKNQFFNNQQLKYINLIINLFNRELLFINQQRGVLLFGTNSSNLLTQQDILQIIDYQKIYKSHMDGIKNQQIIFQQSQTTFQILLKIKLQKILKTQSVIQYTEKVQQYSNQYGFQYLPSSISFDLNLLSKEYKQIYCVSLVSYDPISQKSYLNQFTSKFLKFKKSALIIFWTVVVAFLVIFTIIQARKKNIYVCQKSYIPKIYFFVLYGVIFWHIIIFSITLQPRDQFLYLPTYLFLLLKLIQIKIAKKQLIVQIVFLIVNYFLIGIAPFVIIILGILIINKDMLVNIYTYLKQYFCQKFNKQNNEKVQRKSLLIILISIIIDRADSLVYTIFIMVDVAHYFPLIKIWMTINLLFIWGYQGLQICLKEQQPQKQRSHISYKSLTMFQNQINE